MRAEVRWPAYAACAGALHGGKGSSSRHQARGPGLNWARERRSPPIAGSGLARLVLAPSPAAGSSAPVWRPGDASLLAAPG